MYLFRTIEIHKKMAKKLVRATWQLGYSPSAEWEEMKTLSLIYSIHPDVFMNALKELHGDY